MAPGQENAQEKYGSGGSSEEKYGSGGNSENSENSGNSVDPAESGKGGEEEGKWTDVPENPEGHLIEDSNENPTIYPADEATEAPPPGEESPDAAEDTEQPPESGAPDQPPEESGAPENPEEAATDGEGEGAGHEGAGEKKKFRKVEFASQQECLTCEFPRLFRAYSLYHQSLGI